MNDQVCMRSVSIGTHNLTCTMTGEKIKIELSLVSIINSH